MTPGLNAEQMKFFNAFGYVIFRQFFTPQEVQTIQREVSAEMAMQYAATPFDGSRRHWTVMMDQSTPFFAHLLEDPRFLLPAKQIWGDDVLGIMTDSNRYVGDTPWHPDSRLPDFNGIKFAMYLDPVGAKTGALRVIPGSHLLTDDANEVLTAGIRANSIEGVPATVLDSQPGDVVMFNHRLWHASCGGKTDRRMCTCIYYANPKTAAGAEQLVKLAKMNVDFSHREFRPQRQHIYPRYWMENTKNSPDRAYWIKRQREIGCFEPEDVVEAAPAAVR